MFVLRILQIICPDCQIRGAFGLDYRGKWSKTESGATCISWAKTTREMDASLGIGDHNYCRNPDMSRVLWCYTARGRENCEGHYNHGSVIPFCEEQIPAGIKEQIKYIANIFSIEFEKIDGKVNTHEMIKSEGHSDMFRQGYEIFLMMTKSSQANTVEYFFENLVMFGPLDGVLQATSSLMQGHEKIYYKQDITEEDIHKGWQSTNKVEILPNSNFIFKFRCVLKKYFDIKFTLIPHGPLSIYHHNFSLILLSQQSRIFTWF